MEQKQANEEVEIDLRELFGVMLEKLWFIILMGLIGGLAMLIISKFVMAPVYQSTTKVYVLSKQDSSTVTSTDLQLGSQLTKDYMELVKSRMVTEEVISELGLDLTHEQLVNMISVETPQDTRILKITVSNTDAYLAKQIANAVRIAASEHISNTMDSDAVNVVDEANIPTAPSSPNVTKNTLIGVALGLIVAIAIVFLIYILDDTIKTPDDVEKFLNLSVLGSIPVLETEDAAKKKKKKSSSSKPTGSTSNKAKNK